MIEEQVLEVNKKIKQIQGMISRRKEKASQWNMNYKKVIQEKQDKSYLRKTCGHRVSFQTLGSEEYEKIKLDLRRKASKSRIKVQKFYNELKDLDELQKQKSKIRVLILKKVQESKSNAKKQDKPKHRAASENEKIVGNQTKTNSTFCRTVKDRPNPFLDDKSAAQKFIEMSSHGKQNLGAELTKYFGVGIENTPLGLKLKKQQKKEDLFNSNQTQYVKNRMYKTSFGKQFRQAFQRKQKIFGSAYQPRNIFEDRIRKIVRYHGDFWKEEFQVK